MEQMVSLAEVFEKQGKEVASRSKPTSSPQGTSGGSPSKLESQSKKMESPPSTNPPNKTLIKTITGPQPHRDLCILGERKPQCWKCKGYEHYKRDCSNVHVMVIGKNDDIYSADEEEIDGSKGE